MPVKRVREKACDVCGEVSDVLYRIQIDPRQGWLFACPADRRRLEAEHPGGYRYGGTWKARKRH